MGLPATSLAEIDKGTALDDSRNLEKLMTVTDVVVASNLWVAVFVSINTGLLFCFSSFTNYSYSGAHAFLQILYCCVTAVGVVVTSYAELSQRLTLHIVFRLVPILVLAATVFGSSPQAIFLIVPTLCLFDMILALRLKEAPKTRLRGGDRLIRDAKIKDGTFVVDVGGRGTMAILGAPQHVDGDSTVLAGDGMVEYVPPQPSSWMTLFGYWSKLPLVLISMALVLALQRYVDSGIFDWKLVVTLSSLSLITRYQLLLGDLAQRICKQARFFGVDIVAADSLTRLGSCESFVVDLHSNTTFVSREVLDFKIIDSRINIKSIYQIALLLGAASKEPIFQAIARYVLREEHFTGAELSAMKISEAISHGERGIVAKVNSYIVHLGDERFLLDSGVVFSPSEVFLGSKEKSGLYLAVSGSLVAAILLNRGQDLSAVEAIEGLRERGLKIGGLSLMPQGIAEGAAATIGMHSGEIAYGLTSEQYCARLRLLSKPLLISGRTQEVEEQVVTVGLGETSNSHELMLRSSSLKNLATVGFGAARRYVKYFVQLKPIVGIASIVLPFLALISGAGEVVLGGELAAVALLYLGRHYMLIKCG